MREGVGNKLEHKNEYEKKELTDFFGIIHDVEFEKFYLDITKNAEIYFKNLYIFVDSNNLNNKDKNIILSTFFIRSFLQISIIEKNDFSYITSTELISNFIAYLRKFNIYYNKKDIDDNLVIKNIVKIYGILIERGVLLEKTLIINKKSTLYISIGIYSYKHILRNNMNISYTEFTPMFINNKVFIIGTSFINTVEITRTNTYSNKHIKFKDLEYIQKLCTTFVIVNEQDLDDITKIYEKYYKIKIDDVNKLLSITIEKYRNVLNEIEVNKKFINENYNLIVKEEIIEYIKKAPTKDIFLYIYMRIIGRSVSINKLVVDMFKKKYDKYNECVDDLDAFIREINSGMEINDDVEINDSMEINDADFLFDFYDKNKKELIKIFKKWNLLNDTNELIKLDYNTKDEKEKKLSMIQKEVSLLFQLLNFKIIKDMHLIDKKLYFPFFFDFRSRKYDDSIISVTNFIPSRYFLNYGVYTDKELEEIESEDSHDNYITSYLNFINIIKKMFKIKKEKKYVDRCIFWLLVSLGKEFINKNKSYFTLKELIEEGYNVIKNDDIRHDMEKEIIITHSKKIIKSLNSDNPIKRFIHKDATASFIQNLIRILGAKDKDSLLKANLSSNYRWYDTYNLALEEWKKRIDHNEISEKYLKYFIRKTIKKPIMTAAYDSTFIRKWDYFIISLEEEFGIYLRHDKDLLMLFKNFTDYIDDIFLDDIFLEKKSELIKEKVKEKIEKNRSVVLTSFNLCTDLIYFKSKTSKIYIDIEKKDGKRKRRTKNVYIVDEDNIFYRKLYQSSKANWVHFSDATLVMQINNKYETPLLSIHDCFLVDMLNVGKFIDIANKAFREISYITLSEKNILDGTYSLFIFI